MRLIQWALALFSATAECTSILQTFSEPRQHVLTNPAERDQSMFKIPSVHESAIMARRILHLTNIGTLVTSFPQSYESTSPTTVRSPEVLENRPAGVEGSPIGLMEYIADCEPDSGNPTILALNVATPFRNYGAGSNISLSLRWWPKQTSSYFADSLDDDLFTPRTPAALPRFSLHGHLESISDGDLVKQNVAKCFVSSHPDSRWWQPGNRIHEAHYMRLVVEHVYWLGGFGDRARIQWLPIEEWQNVTKEEIAECRLPGEQKRSSSWLESWSIWN